MKDLSENKIKQIFNEGLEQLVLPILDDIYKNMATKKDLEVVKKDVKEIKEDITFIQTDVDSIKRTLNTEVSWRDNASKRLKSVEVKLGLVNK